MNLKNIHSLAPRDLIARANAFQWAFENMQGKLRELGQAEAAESCNEGIDARCAGGRADPTSGERAYLGLLEHLMANGQYKPNRTGVSTFADVGHTLRFDLRQGFPALTTKKLAFNAVKGELLGFFRGYDNAADFRALGCKVWDQNANETPSWVNNPNRKGVDALGRIYGVQWTKWRDVRYSQNKDDYLRLANSGEYRLVFGNPQTGEAVFEREVNQLENALRTLLTNPTDRRIIISGWRPDEIQEQALPACHVLYQFVAMPDNTLHITMAQRSVDTFLGLGFNIASTALMLSIMARMVGMEPASVSIFLTDTHIYENHVQAASEQVTREPFAPCKLELSDNIKRITDLSDIRGAFERIQPEDIKLVDYEHHAAIKAPMAA